MKEIARLKEYCDENGLQEFKTKYLKPVTFIHCDNKEYLKTVPYKHFHLGIIDPPYGVNVGNMDLGRHVAKLGPRDFEMGNWDNATPDKEFWELFFRACRKWIIWGGNYFVSEIKENGRCHIVWDKMNDKMSFAGCELALTNIDANAFLIRRPRNARGIDDEKKRHPTQKPAYIYDKLLQEFVDKSHYGFKVLDTHGGSFNHAIAAHRNNVDLVIMDREESYFKSGIAAFENSCLNGRLF